jgi:serine/threonine protein kinase
VAIRYQDSDGDILLLQNQNDLNAMLKTELGEATGNSVATVTAFISPAGAPREAAIRAVLSAPTPAVPGGTLQPIGGDQRSRNFAASDVALSPIANSLINQSTPSVLEGALSDLSFSQPTPPQTSHAGRENRAGTPTLAPSSISGIFRNRNHIVGGSSGGGLGSSSSAFVSSSSSSLLSSEQQQSKWQCGEQIGRGAYGTVYLGLDIASGELMAVKQIDASEVSGRELAALEHEVSVLRNLHHENIVQYLGTQRTGSTLSIFLEYAPGGSIRQIINRFGSLDEQVIRRYTRQLLLGLEYLHRNGFAHRDIKGGNVLVGNDGVIKLADFGQAKRIASKSLVGTSEGGGSDALVGSGSGGGAGGVSRSHHVTEMRGTPLWMAPEVIKEQHMTRGWRKADIWSVGCTVIEMATGNPPWSDFDSTVSAMYTIACTEALPTFPEHLSHTAREFLTLCFNRDPSKRPDATLLLMHPFVSGGGGGSSVGSDRISIGASSQSGSVFGAAGSAFLPPRPSTSHDQRDRDGLWNRGMPRGATARRRQQQQQQQHLQQQQQQQSITLKAQSSSSANSVSNDTSSSPSLLEAVSSTGLEKKQSTSSSSASNKPFESRHVITSEEVVLDSIYASDPEEPGGASVDSGVIPSDLDLSTRGQINSGDVYLSSNISGGASSSVALSADDGSLDGSQRDDQQGYELDSLPGAEDRPITDALIVDVHKFNDESQSSQSKVHELQVVSEPFEFSRPGASHSPRQLVQNRVSLGGGGGGGGGDRERDTVPLDMKQSLGFSNLQQQKQQVQQHQILGKANPRATLGSLKVTGTYSSSVGGTSHKRPTPGPASSAGSVDDSPSASPYLDVSAISLGSAVGGASLAPGANILNSSSGPFFAQNSIPTSFHSSSSSPISPGFTSPTATLIPRPRGAMSARPLPGRATVRTTADSSGGGSNTSIRDLESPPTIASTVNASFFENRTTAVSSAAPEHEVRGSRVKDTRVSPTINTSNNATVLESSHISHSHRRRVGGSHAMSASAATSLHRQQIAAAAASASSHSIQARSYFSSGFDSSNSTNAGSTAARTGFQRSGSVSADEFESAFPTYGAFIPAPSNMEPAMSDADYFDGFSSSREFSTHGGSRNQPSTQRLRAPRSANVKLGTSLLSQQIQRQQGWGLPSDAASSLDSASEQYVTSRTAIMPSDSNISGSSFSGSAGATISQSNESSVISERERQVQLSLTILRARSGKTRTGRSTSASVTFSGSAANVADNDANQNSASSPTVDNTSSSFSGYHAASYNNSYLQRKVLMSQQQRSPVVNRAPSASRLHGGPSSSNGSVSPVRYQSWGTSAWTTGVVDESIANNYSSSPIRSPKD